MTDKTSYLVIFVTLTHTEKQMKSKILMLSLAATVAMTNLTSCIEDEEMDETTKAIIDQKKQNALADAKGYAELSEVERQQALAEAKAALAKAENDLVDAKGYAALSEVQRQEALVEANAALVRAESDLVDAKVNFKVFNKLTGDSESLYSIYSKKESAEDEYYYALKNLSTAQRNYDQAVANNEKNTEYYTIQYENWLNSSNYYVSVYEEQVAELKAAIESYENAGTKEQIESLTKQIDELQAQLDAVKVKRAEYKATIEAENAGYTSEIATLENKMMTLGDDNGRTTYPNDETLNDYQKQYYELSDEIEALESEWETWKYTQVSDFYVAVSGYGVISEQISKILYENSAFMYDSSKGGIVVNSDSWAASYITNYSLTRDYPYSYDYYTTYHSWDEYYTENGSTYSTYMSFSSKYTYNSNEFFAVLYNNAQNLLSEYTSSSYSSTSEFTAIINYLSKVYTLLQEYYNTASNTNSDYSNRINDLYSQRSNVSTAMDDYKNNLYNRINIIYAKMPSTTNQSLENQYNELTTQIRGKENIRSVYEGIENEYSNYDDGLAALNRQLLSAQSNLADYQEQVVNYEAALEKIKAGTFDSLQNAELLKVELEAAQARLDDAKEALDYYTELYTSTLSTIASKLSE